jgi:hypothetical protein
MKIAECFMPVTINSPHGPRELWERTTYQFGTDSKVRIVIPDTEKDVAGYVADYLVEADWCCECASKKCIPYKEKTYPIGQQPEDSVMVPGSEREVTE